MPLIKIPIPANETERLKALDNYEILNSISEYEFDRITEMASLICDVPVSLITLVDENRQWFKSSKGLDATETSRDIAFCAYTIMDTVFFEIEDATKDDRFKDNTLVTGDMNIRFYAGFPLVDPQGYALGTLCVIDHKPNALTDSQKRALQLLAEEVIALIVSRRQKEELKNFEKIFELSNDLLFIGGQDGFFKKINPAFEKVLGWSKQYLLNTSTFEFIHPDDIEGTTKELQKLSEGSDCVNFIQRFKTSDNRYRSIQWTSSPEQATGNIFGIGRDVTEVLQKEHELALSEEKLKAFFENSQGLMCTHNIDGDFITVNSAGSSILGYTADEIVKMSLFDIVPQEHAPQIRSYLTDIKNTGHGRGQMVTVGKDGSKRIWMYNNILQKSTDNEVYVIGNAIDITERHKLEKDLQFTKALLEQTNTVAKVGGWQLDLRQQKIFWTAVTKEIHGVPPDFEPDLTTGINFYKEGESRDKITSAINLAIGEGKAWDEELQIINTGGKEMWVRAIGNAEFEDGKCKRLYGTFQDINDHKLAELALQESVVTTGNLNKALVEQINRVKEQDQTIKDIQEYKFLADSIPEIIWTSNADGTLDYYNQHWFTYTGLTFEETMASGWAAALHADDIERDLQEWQHSLATGSPYQSEVRFKRVSDGSYRWNLARALPMKDENGTIVKWFGSCTDIDEYKRALDLENRISQYEDFNRIVAHNLRGPAGSIGMILDMIAEAPDDDEKNDLMGMLTQSSATLNEALSDLMKVLEVRNNYNLPYDDCDFETLVDSIERMLTGQIISKKAVITTDFKVAGMAFPKMYLESIFYNMISNSLKYSQPDVPPQIVITSKIMDGRLVLSFSDNGLGIDLKRHGKNIFKLNGIFHSGFDSKGVGLFMTKTQIETFGGRISVESEPNVGTTFTIVF